MRELPSPAPTGAPWSSPVRLLGTGLLVLAPVLLLVGVFLDAGRFVHGADRVWVAALAASSLFTLGVSLGGARAARGLGPAELGILGPLTRVAALVLFVVSLNGAVVVGRALLLPVWSAPGAAAWLTASWVALAAALLVLVVGGHPPTASGRTILGGTANVLAATLVVGLAVGTLLPYGHESAGTGGEAPVPGTVGQVVWTQPPYPGRASALHPTAHGVLEVAEDRVFGVNRSSNVTTWSYTSGGEPPEVVVRAGGEIVDVLLPGREAFLTLDTRTGEPVVPPPGSGRPVADSSGEALVRQLGAHPGDALWEYGGEEGCLPRAGGRERLDDEGVVAVGDTVVVALLCAEGLTDPLEGDVRAAPRLVGLDSTTGERLWSVDHPGPGTELRAGGGVDLPVPVTAVSLGPTPHTGSWAGDAVAFEGGPYVDAADGTVLHPGDGTAPGEGEPLEGATVHGGRVLVDFGADSYVNTVWTPGTEGTRSEVAPEDVRVWFEERAWDGRLLRETAPVALERPPPAAHTEPLTDAVVHAVDGATVLVHPWGGSPHHEVTSPALTRMELKGAPLPLAVPGSVLLLTPAGDGLVAALG
ncbi:hypothetical protein ABZ635_10410 [Nocardiopsis sp. NPDC007018]|uniref:hypothetical protein n=1 Tax=Nocardiopsis sp. NPDC007018 TaxID=3155721 RepID=UPI0033F196CD